MSQFSLALDSSQIVSFMTCRRKWYHEYRLNIELKDKDHDFFSKGTIMHGLLERYYQNIDLGWDKAQKIACESLRADRKLLGLVDPTTFENLLARFLLYVSIHQNDLIPVVHNEKKCVELGFSYPLVDNNLFLFVLEGRVDLVAKFDQFIVVVDHKSQGRRKKFYSRTIQFMDYCLALNTSRMMINVIGVQDRFKPEYMFQQLFYYSPEVLKEWKKKLILIFYQIANAIITETFEKNESACPGKYDYPCEFCQICEETAPDIQKQLIQIKYKEREPWQPWSETE